jgi:hypothetical protein
LDIGPFGTFDKYVANWFIEFSFLVEEDEICNLEKLGVEIDDECVDDLLRGRMSGHSDTDPWPWTSVGEGRRGVGEYGLVLGYEPKYTREKWEMMQREERGN